MFYNLAFIKQLCAETAVRAVIRRRGVLFDHVNQTGTHTPVKGMPTNKKQCKSGQNGMQHETEESTTRTAKNRNVATIKTGQLSFPG